VAREARRWCVALLVVVWGAAGCDSRSGGASLSGGQHACQVPQQAQQWEQEVLDLVNEERVSRGLGAVRANATLKDMAADYACEMITGGFFAHVDPNTGSTLGTRTEDHGYEFLKVGENLAAGQLSPEEVMAAWMNSEDHRANILDADFVELGVAVRTGGEYGIYWVQEFGWPPE
jgi:uncharacterized protein YkwD